MKIAIASDHNGSELKSDIIKYLKEKEHNVIDCSPVNTPTDDYPDFAFKVCKEVINKNAEIGILFCGTGIGMSIAANKVKGIRCAKVDSVEDAILTRNDNGANVMSFSFKKSLDEITKLIDAFIETDTITAERHQRRIDKIIKYENGEYYEL